MTPVVHVTDDPGPVAGALVRGAIGEVLARRARCRLAIAGGSSPGPVLAWLAVHLSPVDAARLVLTWVDERHLPITGDWTTWPADSNRRLAWERWLSRVPVRPRELPLDAPGTLEEARAAVEIGFAALGGLDVVLLGAGPDGHLASLFPGHPALEAPGPVLAVPDSPKPPPERLTLSLGVLERVACAVLVAKGADKAEMLARARAGDPALPLGRYRPAGAWHWVLDPAAAAAL